ncbi:MAG: tetratricopeptide repeat protein [Candidatus Omnitrophica bacterium]|nr:tetratricopeptide repeat protein [Candidatus Omnitrophota bacterium]
MRKFFMVWNFKKKFQPLKIAQELSRSDFLVVLIFCFLLYSFVSAAGAGENEGEIRALLAEAYIADGDYESAIEEYREVLKNDPGNIEARAALADILSWNKKYGEALELYNEILKDKEAPEIRLQKARILGWAREYDKSEKEYQKILDIEDNKGIELEMKAKLSYWNNRVKRAIRYYKELIDTDPKNLEAMFDLSQVYAYQSMWDDAIQIYRKIIDVSSTHFRAKEGLEKAKLISEYCSLKSGYEFFEADSTGRDQDIRRHSSFNEFNYPLNYNLNLNTTYRLTYRSFADFGDLLENEGRIKVSYINNPNWSVGGFYDFIAYNKDINTMHTFGASYNFRIFDYGMSNFSYQRERLENNSKVIRDGYYIDNYKERLDIDINKRFKLGMDYLFAGYSDSNYKHEPGLDLLYYFSLDPKRFAVKYRYFYKNFDKKVSDYFSPKGFSTNSLALNWRHFLNKEEIFFGADDLYYDLGYDISVDSGDIVSHKFSGEFNWDISKRLNLNIRASVVNLSASVYRDKSITAQMKYYF